MLLKKSLNQLHILLCALKTKFKNPFHKMPHVRQIIARDQLRIISRVTSCILLGVSLLFIVSSKIEISKISADAAIKASHVFDVVSTNAKSNIPTDLKVNQLTEAYGVPSTDPTFSWIMNDNKSNQLQTAYEIVISTSLEQLKAGDKKSDILDTGKVVSGESSYVKINKLKLSDNSLYYWKVRVWDSAGTVSGFSEPATLTTATGSKWASCNTIWVGDSTYYENSDWKNYSISLDMNVTSVSAGINFRATNDGKSYYSWQFNTAINALIPQVCIDGKIVQLPSISLTSVGVLLQPNHYCHVKIVAFGNIISTYIGTVLVDKRTVSYLPSGSFGFQNGASESCNIKNIRVYSLNKSGRSKKTLYSDAFASNVNAFSGGTVSNEALTVGNDTAVYLKPVASKKDIMFLRNEFEIKDTSAIQKAVVNVMSTSVRESDISSTSGSTSMTKQYTYSLYLNGSSVGVGPCESIDNEIRYSSYDVTSLLKNGVNAIGSLNYALTCKQFLLQMTVYYKDGTSKILLNSGRDYKNWRSLDGARIFGENQSVGTIFYTQTAENIDATLYPFGWDKPNFNDSKWLPVTLAKAVAQSSLVPSSESNVGKYESNVAKVVDKGNGNYFIDLGKEVVGGISLTVTSKKVFQITMRYGEEKSGNTSVKYKMITDNCYQEKWTIKRGKQTISNFGIKNFRYVEIFNSRVAITADNIHAVSVRQSFDDNASDFRSSNTDLNNIYDLTKYSIKETNQTLQVDSQARERGAYQGDTLINMLASFAVDPDPTLSQYTTEYLNYNGSWPAEYKLMSVILTWKDYIYTGNLDMVKKYYNKLKSDRLYDNLFDSKYNLIKRANDRLNSQDSVLIDWPLSEQDGYDKKDAEYNTVVNAVAYGAYVDMAQMAEKLGETADATAYTSKADKIKTAMMTYLYNSKVGAFSDGLTANGTQINHFAQHASAFALAFGVVTDKSAQKSVATYLGKDGVFKTSVYGAMFTLTGLYEADEGDIAMQLLTNNGIRSWNHMIKSLGATITAEDWDPSIKANMTFSHPWATAPASQIVSGLFGIQPLTAGFSSFQIKFQPGSLTYATIKVPTVKGTVEASFNKTSGFSSTVIIPDNTRAKVYIPTTDENTDTLLVDGKKVAATRSGNYLMVELGSGKHTSCTGGNSRS